MHPVYWQLHYPDGKVLDEPVEGGPASSLHNVPRGATMLTVTAVQPDGSRRVNVGIRLELGRGERPVFYRIRESSLDGTGEIDLVATVFGRATKRDGGTLWEWRGGRDVPCRPEMIDETAIRLLVEH